jgi:hypothetical protein
MLLNNKNSINIIIIVGKQTKRGSLYAISYIISRFFMLISTVLNCISLPVPDTEVLVQGFASHEFFSSTAVILLTILISDSFQPTFPVLKTSKYANEIALLSVCLYAHPSTVVRQRLGKHILAAMNTYQI